MRARGGERGFTLVELLVGLAILALAATLLLEGIIRAGALVRRTRDREANGDSVAAAQIILRDRLERMIAFGDGSPTAPSVDIDGNDQVLSFTGSPPPAAPFEALQRYRLMLAATGDLMLYRTSTRNDRVDPRARTIDGWTAATLLSGVGSLSLSYYGGIPTDPRPQWHGVWRQNPSSPRLVRVRIGFREDDRRIWPDLVVRPGTTVDLGCGHGAQPACGSPT